jgi:uncharacterized protein (DUF433 family)
MDWRDHITSDSDVLAGKPAVRGTRLSVELLLGLLAAGWTPEQLLASYPGLTPDGLRAVFAFAAEVLRDEAVFALRPGAG